MRLRGIKSAKRDAEPFKNRSALSAREAHIFIRQRNLFNCYSQPSLFGCNSGKLPLDYALVIRGYRNQTRDFLTQYSVKTC
jgi:hypothetical protein